jgi:hypothetical protein
MRKRGGERKDHPGGGSQKEATRIEDTDSSVEDLFGEYDNNKMQEEAG